MKFKEIPLYGLLGTGVALVMVAAVRQRRGQVQEAVDVEVSDRQDSTGELSLSGSGVESPKSKPHDAKLAGIPISESMVKPGLADPSSTHPNRLRPDVLLAPLILVLAGVLIDRLRESYARESITAWVLMIGLSAVAVLSRQAGYRWANRCFYLVLVLVSYSTAELYVHSPSGKLPAAWVWSSVAAAGLWAIACTSSSISTARPWGDIGTLHFAEASEPVVRALVDLVAWGMTMMIIAPVATGYLFAPLDARHYIGGPLDWVWVILGSCFGLVAMVAATTYVPYRVRIFCIGFVFLVVVRFADSLPLDVSWTAWMASHWQAVVIWPLFAAAVFVPRRWLSLHNWWTRLMARLNLENPRQGSETKGIEA